MFSFMLITKALADENRVRILMALTQRDLCVCQITGLLDLAPSTTSKHLSILRQAQLIDHSKQGKWVYYSLPAKDSTQPYVASTISWLQQALHNHPKITEDTAKLRHILAQEDLCPWPISAEELTCHSVAIHAIDQDNYPLEETTVTK